MQLKDFKITSSSVSFFSYLLVLASLVLASFPRGLLHGLQQMEASSVLIEDRSCEKKVSPNINILIIEPHLPKLVYVLIPEPTFCDQRFWMIWLVKLGSSDHPCKGRLRSVPIKSFELKIRKGLCLREETGCCSSELGGNGGWEAKNNMFYWNTLNS